MGDSGLPATRSVRPRDRSCAIRWLEKSGVFLGTCPAVWHVGQPRFFLLRLIGDASCEASFGPASHTFPVRSTTPIRVRVGAGVGSAQAPYSQRCDSRFRAWRSSSTPRARWMRRLSRRPWPRLAPSSSKPPQLPNRSPSSPVTATSRHTARVVSVGGLELVGGGGTDMGAGLAAAARLRPRPQLVVVLTDGYTPWPARKPSGIAVVIGLIGESDAAPSWARAVRIPVI